MSNNISSIHFKKSTRFQVYHNDKIRPSYAIGGEILCNKSSEEAVKLRDEIIEKAKENYQKNNKSRNKNFQTTNYLWSAVVNIRNDVKTDDAMKQLEELADYFHKTHKFQCFQISIHRDEGHINENGEKVINHHAHLEFVTLDKENGRQVFKMRDFNKDKLREIQTETAKILNMERGKAGNKRIEPRKYGAMKEQEKANTRELKQDLEQVKAENKALKQELASQKAVNTAFEEIRQLMIADGISTADDYKELAKYKKQAQAQAKNKTLTQEQLNIQIAQIQQSYNDKLKAKDDELKAKDEELKAKDEEIEKLEKVVEPIKEYTEPLLDDIIDIYTKSPADAGLYIKKLWREREQDSLDYKRYKRELEEDYQKKLADNEPTSQNKADDVKEQIKTLEKENKDLKAENNELKQIQTSFRELIEYVKEVLNIPNILDNFNQWIMRRKAQEQKSQAPNHAEPKQEIQLTAKKEPEKPKNRGFGRC